MDELFPDFQNPQPGSFPTFNFNNHEDRAPMLIASNTTFIILSLIFTTMRLCTRKFITKKLYLEDYLIGVTWLLALAASAFSCLTTKAQVGKHYWDIPPSFYENPPPLPANYIYGSFYWVNIMLIKVAILMLYLRLTPSLTFRNWVFGVMFFVIASGVSIGIATTIPCLPVRANWDFTAMEGAKCISFPTIITTQAVFHVLGDLLVLVLPMPILWKSPMPNMKKVQVMANLSLGGVVSIISIVRLQCVIESHQPRQIIDYHFTAAKLLALCGVEMNIGIICSCLPASRQFLRQFFPRMFGSNAGTPNVYASAERSQAGSAGAKEKSLEEGSGSTIVLRARSSSTVDASVPAGEGKGFEKEDSYSEHASRRSERSFL